MSIIQCPGCGVVTDNARPFCGQCGAALQGQPPRRQQATPTTALVPCEACGGEVSYEAKACPHCGHKVGGSATFRSLMASSVAKQQAGQRLSAGDTVKAGVGLAYAVAYIGLGVVFIIVMAVLAYGCATAGCG